MTKRTTKACYFQIALFDDHWYGRNLHLSVFPPEWWQEKILAVFGSAEFRMVKNQHLLAVARP